VSPWLPFQGTLKPFFHKPLPQFLYPPPVHPYPVSGHIIGIPFFGEQQGLCSFTFLGAVFPLVDDFMEYLFFVFRERHPVFLLWHIPSLLVPLLVSIK
jgi:hypothetical protein